MSYPGPGAIHRQCIMCGRPFRVWESELKKANRGKFCTRECYSESRRAFSEALCDGRLESILMEELARARSKRRALKQ
jgi:hypothetical protein